MELVITVDNTDWEAYKKEAVIRKQDDDTRTDDQFAEDKLKRVVRGEIQTLMDRDHLRTGRKVGTIGVDSR